MEKNQRTVSFEAGESGEKKNRKWLFLAVAVLVGAPIIGSTLAATITINGVSGNPEFAQGTAPTSSCDVTMDAAPEASWSTVWGNFKLGKITISSVDATTCAGKKLRVQVVDSSNNLIEWCGTSCTVGVISMFEDGASSLDVSGSASGTDVGFTDTGVDNSNRTFTITLAPVDGTSGGDVRPAASQASQILIETLS